MGLIISLVDQFLFSSFFPGEKALHGDVWWSLFPPTAQEMESHERAELLRLCPMRRLAGGVSGVPSAFVGNPKAWGGGEMSLGGIFGCIGFPALGLVAWICCLSPWFLWRRVNEKANPKPASRNHRLDGSGFFLATNEACPVCRGRGL